jgi:hypothetical protein
VRVEQVCVQQILANREHYGIASPNVRGKHIEALTPVVGRRRAGNHPEAGEEEGEEDDQVGW